jgi:hypothetical protein
MSKMRGNGTTKVVIASVLVRKGMVFFKAGDPPPADSDLPFFLSKAIADWQVANPTARVRSTLGFVEDGFTTGVYVWFDEEQ